MPKEPQSYGSQGDSVDGDFGGEVNRQSADPVSHPSENANEPAQKVTARKSGAKRGGFFKDRDYRG